ncbi:peptidase M23 [Oscillatoriales cyanobacterium USR001]|nr:peptidase M23 [Oscillatoriales cyanobacterium USR001]
MISFSKKYISKLFLALALVVLSSCFNKGSSTTANSPQVETTTRSPEVSQSIAQTPKFAPPISCTLGKDCYIFHYVDRDPTPAAVDFGCGRQTYDGHNGTDFGIPDEKTMAKGVPVIAAAAGKVLRSRDGVEDIRVNDQTTKKQVEGIECGNGMVIDHGNGWETQYCHLRKGSVVVKPGMQVEKGTVLGMIGESGLASFPHVHLTIRYQGKVVDPFVGINSESGCQVARNPLWDRPLNYVPTGLIRAGFAPKAPDLDALWKGEFSETTLAANSPAILFWVQVFGVLQGDRESYKLFTPDGKMVGETNNDIKSSNRAWVSYVGKKNRENNTLMLGTWRAEYQLKRGDRVLIDIKRQVEVGLKK